MEERGYKRPAGWHPLMHGAVEGSEMGQSIKGITSMGTLRVISPVNFIKFLCKFY
jgi:hypothetical protein